LLQPSSSSSSSSSLFQKGVYSIGIKCLSPTKCQNFKW